MKRTGEVKLEDILSFLLNDDSGKMDVRVLIEHKQSTIRARRRACSDNLLRKHIAGTGSAIEKRERGNARSALR